MLRMSFMEHLEELRSRIIRALAGFGVAFLVCLWFASPIWDYVQAPGLAAFKAIGRGGFIAIEPMEQFSIIWMWAPLVASLFIASPWVIYQVWAFIAPGLYPKERRWAVPFVLCTAGLFITGGLFAYFIAFRFALTFLLNIGGPVGVTAADLHRPVLRPVRRRDAGNLTGVRVAGADLLPDADPRGLAGLSVAAFALRDPGDRDSGRDHHARLPTFLT